MDNIVDITTECQFRWLECGNSLHYHAALHGATNPDTAARPDYGINCYVDNSCGPETQYNLMDARAMSPPSRRYGTGKYSGVQVNWIHSAPLHFAFISLSLLHVPSNGPSPSLFHLSLRGERIFSRRKNYLFVNVSSLYGTIYSPYNQLTPL